MTVLVYTNSTHTSTPAVSIIPGFATFVFICPFAFPIENGHITGR